MKIFQHSSVFREPFGRSRRKQLMEDQKAIGRGPGSRVSGPTTAVDHTVLDHLFRRVADGEKEAFSQLYKVTAPRLMAVAVRILGDRARAEESLQEAFLLVWLKAPTFDIRQGRLLALMTKIVRNCALDRLRYERARPCDPSDDLPFYPDPKPTPFDICALASDFRAISAKLRTMSARSRNTFSGIFIRDLTHRAYAAQTDIPLGTVKTEIRRVLRELRACL